VPLVCNKKLDHISKRKTLFVHYDLNVFYVKTLRCDHMGRERRIGIRPAPGVESIDLASRLGRRG
jgi:hypothetical protein